MIVYFLKRQDGTYRIDAWDDHVQYTDKLTLARSFCGELGARCRQREDEKVIKMTIQKDDSYQMETLP